MSLTPGTHTRLLHVIGGDMLAWIEDGLSQIKRIVTRTSAERYGYNETHACGSMLLDRIDILG